jgi:hypothetical protein
VTDAEVITAIRANHLKANISNPYYVRHHWDQAWVDRGGTIFGPGPYVHLPVDAVWEDGSDKTDRLVIRVYPPARLRRKLARHFFTTGNSIFNP